MIFQATLAQFNADPTPEAVDIPLIKGKNQTLQVQHNLYTFTTSSISKQIHF